MLDITDESWTAQTVVNNDTIFNLAPATSAQCVLLPDFLPSSRRRRRRHYVRSDIYSAVSYMSSTLIIVNWRLFRVGRARRPSDRPTGWKSLTQRAMLYCSDNLRLQLFNYCPFHDKGMIFFSAVVNIGVVNITVIFASSTSTKDRTADVLNERCQTIIR